MIDRISPEEAKQRLDDDPETVYLDVRSVEEFAAGHPPCAKNVPVLESGPMGMAPNAQFVDVCEANFDKDAKIITGCLRGGRSLRAAQMLIAAGGGFDAELGPGGVVGYEGWQRRGLPVSAECAPGESYEDLSKPI